MHVGGKTIDVDQAPNVMADPPSSIIHFENPYRSEISHTKYESDIKPNRSLN
jgi:hypothetical protein